MKKQLPVLQDLRALKTKKEQDNIIRAQRISEEILSLILEKLRIGISEKEVADSIIKMLIERRVTALPFPPIVAFGKGTADIHHEPNDTKLKKGDIVMLDFGATWDGYCSDMTRTYFFGEPSVPARALYEGVLTAQNKVIEALIKGEQRGDVLDSIAREYLYKKFGKKSFPHGLGHGVGTVIHEWPTLRPKSLDILKPGMVVTVEPGVYKKGFGGIRIEDMILITKKGIVNLTKPKKDLKSITLPIRP